MKNENEQNTQHHGKSYEPGFPFQRAMHFPFADEGWPSDRLGRTLRACLNQIRRWRSPPNWSSQDWFEEIRQVAFIAASQAEFEYDRSTTAEPGAFIYQRVRAAALTRYRQEWRYAARCVPHLAAPSGDADDEAPAQHRLEYAVPAANPNPKHGELHETLAALTGKEQSLIEKLFWEDRTQSETAAALGVSQGTVNKWKRAVLDGLHRQLAKNENY